MDIILLVGHTFGVVLFDEGLQLVVIVVLAQGVEDGPNLVAIHLVRLARVEHLKGLLQHYGDTGRYSLNSFQNSLTVHLFIVQGSHVFLSLGRCTCLNDLQAQTGCGGSQERVSGLLVLVFLLATSRKNFEHSNARPTPQCSFFSFSRRHRTV